MSDPAADAALLALVRMTGKAWNRGQALETAARESLAPIRELHKRAYLNDNPYEPAKWDCDECETPWPCDTARLCYTTDELKPEGIQ